MKIKKAGMKKRRARMPAIPIGNHDQNTVIFSRETC